MTRITIAISPVHRCALASCARLHHRLNASSVLLLTRVFSWLVTQPSVAVTTTASFMSPRVLQIPPTCQRFEAGKTLRSGRSEEHTSELQSRFELVCRL